MPKEAPDANSNPAYKAALTFAMQALYSNGGAKHVADSLKKSRDPVEALSNTAYSMTALVDEKTKGSVPDELFALLAAKILQEVADIAEAAHIDLKPSDIAMALKDMILRYLGEQGVDTSKLQQAMSQVNPEDFNQAVAKKKGSAPAPMAPAPAAPPAQGAPL
jgi:hypothetical protein